MTEEEKQLLLKDLCGRLPYGVICELSNNIVNIIERLELGGLEQFITGNLNVRPYLRPMSSMTEEEKILMATTCLKYANGDVEGAVSELSDFYNRRHLDYHGLIGRGLALEAKEGMYKTE